MNVSRFRLWVFSGLTAAAVVLGAPGASTAQSGPGWMVLDPLNESLGSVVSLSGTITNVCTATLPSGSMFQFQFDGKAFAGFTITTALGYGGSQSFSVTGTIPPDLPKPKKNTTSLDFTIVLPKAPLQLGGNPDQKTSPCLVTLAPGTPM
jgi:hypothetical protein